MDEWKVCKYRLSSGFFQSEAPGKIFEIMKENVNSYDNEADQIQFNDKHLSDIDVLSTENLIEFMRTVAFP